jgi:uncharacterized protein (DUF2336 family)
MSEPAARSSIDPSDFGPASGGEPPARPSARSRATLLKRLADVVCLPGSRVNAFERSMTADLLIELLREAAIEERVRIARRIANVSEIPTGLARLLMRDDLEVARALLEYSATVGDGYLIDCVRTASTEHRRLIASRRGLNEVVGDELVQHDEPAVIEALLRNDLAKLSHEAIETIVAGTRDHPRHIALLLRRSELRPSHAYVMFWWSDAEARRVILQRFAVSREVLQEAVSDVFAMAADENWQDPLTRKALQFIERRQRNRAAIAKSPFESLDEAVQVASESFTREVAEEISYLSGLKPMTGAKIFTDPGGEPLAILCKATGLPKNNVRLLWRALRRPEADAAGNINPGLERLLTLFDTIAVDRAQTVLRYWNWSLSSALTPALIKAIRDGDEAALDEFSQPQRAAMLALSGDLRRR